MDYEEAIDKISRICEEAKKGKKKDKGDAKQNSFQPRNIFGERL